MHDNKELLSHCEQIDDWNHHMVRNFPERTLHAHQNQNQIQKEVVVFCYYI